MRVRPSFLALTIRLLQLIAPDDRAGLEAGIARVIDYHALCALLGGAYTDHGQIVGAEDHVLRRNSDRVAVLRTEEVIRGEHEYACLGLSLGGQRQVDSHLVAVEVGIVSGADQRVQTQRAALNENRLESLNAETVQRRRTVEETGCSLITSSRASHTSVRCLSTIFFADLMLLATPSSTNFFITKGRKSSMAISLGTPHWYILRSEADNDNGTAGIVDTLAEQVLTEASLLAP